MEVRPIPLRAILPVAVLSARSVQGATAAYLDNLEQGLLLLEYNGRVAFCSAEAYRLLGLEGEIADWPFRKLLDALSRGRAHERSIALMRLRGPLGRSEACTVPLTISDQNLLLEVTPLTDAGWSVTVELMTDRVDRRQGGPNGALAGR